MTSTKNAWKLLEFVQMIQDGEILTVDQEQEYTKLQEWYRVSYKSSKEWYDEVYPMNEEGKRALIIYDPDGWDRSNWEYSFEKEKITREEFDDRVMHSTCMADRKLMDQWKAANEKVANA